MVRDLHDGAQQRLIHTLVTVRLAQQALEAGDGRASGFLDEAVEQAELAIGELRELVHGILPAVLNSLSKRPRLRGYWFTLIAKACGLPRLAAELDDERERILRVLSLSESPWSGR